MPPGRRQLAPGAPRASYVGSSFPGPWGRGACRSFPCPDGLGVGRVHAPPRTEQTGQGPGRVPVQGHGPTAARSPRPPPACPVLSPLCPLLRRGPPGPPRAPQPARNTGKADRCVSSVPRTEAGEPHEPCLRGARAMQVNYQLALNAEIKITAVQEVLPAGLCPKRLVATQPGAATQRRRPRAGHAEAPRDGARLLCLPQGPVAAHGLRGSPGLANNPWTSFEGRESCPRNLPRDAAGGGGAGCCSRGASDFGSQVKKCTAPRMI